MSDADAFSRFITSQAISHVCLAWGLSETYPSVLNTLTDVTSAYIESIGRLAHDSAERSCRSPADVNLTDILWALVQMPQDGGGVGWRGLRDFAFTKEGDPKWEHPFHLPVPAIPLTSVPTIDRKEKDREGELNAGGGGQGAANGATQTGGSRSLPSYIPSHLPPLPEEHTYKSTSRNRGDKDGGGVALGGQLRRERVKRKRESEEALLKLTRDEGAIQQGLSSSTGREVAAERSHWGDNNGTEVELPQPFREDTAPRHVTNIPKGESRKRARLEGRAEKILEGMLLVDAGPADETKDG